MYAGRIACCPLMSHGKYANETERQTDRRTDARPLHYVFRYGRDQRSKPRMLQQNVADAEEQQPSFRRTGKRKEMKIKSLRCCRSVACFACFIYGTVTSIVLLESYGRTGYL